MFYRPKFCCNCGEKIERAEWSILTSRRFCDVCCLDQRFAYLFPKAAIALIGLVSVAVISGAFRPSGQPDRRFAETSATNPSRASRQLESNLNATPVPTAQSQRENITAGTHNPDPSEFAKIPQPSPKTAEALYFCGAATKKGTACSRRVKHPGERCWQHGGMPAMSDMKVGLRK